MDTCPAPIIPAPRVPKGGAEGAGQGFREAWSWEKHAETLGQEAQEGRDEIHRDLDALEGWDRANLIQVGQGNPKHNYRLGGEWMEQP